MPEDLRTLPVSGEVDLASIGDLIAAARACLAAAPSVLEVDLAEVTFIDSSGLGALVRIRNEAVERGVQLVLVHLPPAVTRLFEVSGLDQALEIRAEEN
jgi:anti-anti-sigma factor